MAKSKIKFINIPAHILNLNISARAKMLLGLIYGFTPKPLMMPNEDIGELLGCTGDNITKILAEIKDYIEVKNPQSRYRKVFYSAENIGVEPKSTQLICPDSPLSCPATPSICPATPSKSTDIYKKILKEKNKTKAESLPLPAKGQARPLPENEKLEACKIFYSLKKKLGMSTDHQPLDGQEFEQKQQDQIKKLYA